MQILTEVAILALTPSRKLVSMDTLMKEFGLALAGVCWLWDRKRMMWISPSQMPVVADDYDLGQLLSQHTRTPIIALDEARTLVYHTHRSQPAGGVLQANSDWQVTYQQTLDGDIAMEPACQRPGETSRHAKQHQLTCSFPTSHCGAGQRSMSVL